MALKKLDLGTQPDKTKSPYKRKCKILANCLEYLLEGKQLNRNTIIEDFKVEYHTADNYIKELEAIVSHYGGKLKYNYSKRSYELLEPVEFIEFLKSRVNLPKRALYMFLIIALFDESVWKELENEYRKSFENVPHKRTDRHFGMELYFISSSRSPRFLYDVDWYDEDSMTDDVDVVIDNMYHSLTTEFTDYTDHVRPLIELIEKNRTLCKYIIKYSQKSIYIVHLKSRFSEISKL